MPWAALPAVGLSYTLRYGFSRFNQGFAKLSYPWLLAMGVVHAPPLAAPLYHLGNYPFRKKYTKIPRHISRF